MNDVTIDDIRESIKVAAKDFPIKKATLFGSRADGTNRGDSDVDLIIEFYEPVSLLTISGLKLQLQDILQLSVDVVHGPIQETDFLVVKNEVELYAA